jgi:hypothetical protein
MKALTIRQPWTWAIIYADKNIENRSWNTTVSGTIAIHAGLNRDRDAKLPRGIKFPSEEELVRGSIIGVADIIDAVDHHRSKWFIGPFGFVLANPRALLRPIPCKGMLSFWEVPTSVFRSIRKQLPID